MEQKSGFTKEYTKVVLMFEPTNTGKTTEPLLKETTINGYLKEMDIINGTHMLIHREGYGENTYRELGEIKSVVYAIVSFLTGALEVDDLFYTLKDNTIYIDRLQVKEQVR